MEQVPRGPSAGQSECLRASWLRGGGHRILDMGQRRQPLDSAGLGGAPVSSSFGSSAPQASLRSGVRRVVRGRLLGTAGPGFLALGPPVQASRLHS
eukprot:215249-Pyramimonas_sp.AAC.1